MVVHDLAPSAPSAFAHGSGSAAVWGLFGSNAHATSEWELSEWTLTSHTIATCHLGCLNRHTDLWSSSLPL